MYSDIFPFEAPFSRKSISKSRAQSVPKESFARSTFEIDFLGNGALYGKTSFYIFDSFLNSESYFVNVFIVIFFVLVQ